MTYVAMNRLQFKGRYSPSWSQLKASSLPSLSYLAVWTPKGAPLNFLASMAAAIVYPLPGYLPASR